MTAPSHDIPALAPCPFCGAIAFLQCHGSIFGGVPGFRIECAGKCHAMTCYWHVKSEAITAWNTRSLTTAMEIGRGMGREEAAKMCEEQADNRSSSNKLIRDRTTKALDGSQIDGLRMAAEFIRTLSPAVDVQGLTERIARALKETVKLKWIMNDSGIGEPELEKVIITEENITLCAHAVLSEFGLGRVKE